MDDPEGYEYSNLTNAVKDKASPLRRYLDARYPTVKPIQAEYRAGAGELLVDGSDANPGTVGAAFDFLVRYRLDPAYDPAIAAAAFTGDAAASAAVAGVAELARTADRASDDFLRATWALALCTEVYRAGLMPGSPLLPLLQWNRFATQELVALATDDALSQLRTLHDVAEERLLPNVAGSKALSIGPTFKASALCAADADLICDGLLLELKSHLGAKNRRSGVRSDGFELADLYQLIAYTLFDRDDAYGIDALGVYSARYGHFVSWPLQDALNTMAGTTIDLQKERKTVWSLLGGA